MTSASKIYLADVFPGMSSRNMGEAALLEALRALSDSEAVELDFGGAVPSPSFADQLVGGLVTRLGLDDFRRRVRLANFNNQVAPLLRHVILRRAGAQHS